MKAAIIIMLMALFLVTICASGDVKEVSNLTLNETAMNKTLNQTMNLTLNEPAMNESLNATINKTISYRHLPNSPGLK